MNKIFTVAWREFSATVFTKGFILGIVMAPVMLAIVAGAVALMKNQKGPQIVGSVAVIDRTGLLKDRIIFNFSEAGIEKERGEDRQRAREDLERAQKRGMQPSTEGQADAALAIAKAAGSGDGPKLSLEFIPPEAALDEAKKPLETAQIRREREGGPSDVSRIAVLVVDPPTVRGDAKGEYPAFQAFYADRLDFEVKQQIEGRVARAIVDARVASDPRIASSGLSPEDLHKLLKRPDAESKTVVLGGEKKSNGELQMLVPMAFMMLLMMSVFTSGQYLLTSTVEEKGNRVMEVLLSAVSPTQLMTGKVLGYMGVGLLILGLYGSLGVAGLVAFAATGLIQPIQLVYLVVFFMIAYFLVASMMAAIGAAVNDMREAQTLMSPIMVLMMLPWLTWFLIQRAPNSPLATALSFIPGPNPFVMMIRVCGSEPVPSWQIGVGILVGVLSVIGAAWAAGKIFRIGALMYGKPPNFKTLWQWVKMA